MAIPDKEERLRRAAGCRQTIDLERRRRGNGGATQQTGSGKVPSQAVENAPDKQEVHNAASSSGSSLPEQLESCSTRLDR